MWEWPSHVLPGVQLSQEATGLLLQLIATLLGTGLSICAKTLSDRGLGVFLIIAGSRAILVVATLAVLVHQKINPLRSKRRLLLLARGLLGFSVITSIFWSVKLLPLADATVLSRLSPMLIAILAPLLLGEPASPGVWLALPACLAGVLAMAQPSFLFGSSRGGGGAGGGGGMSAGGLAVGLSQALAQALTRLSVRALGSTEPTASIIISGAVVTAAGGGLLCMLVPGQLEALPSGSSWAILALMGVIACGLQASSTVALKKVPVAPAAAVNYLSVVWALLADLLMFHHAPSPLSLAGAALICCSTLALMLWEARRGARASGGAGAKGAGSGGERGNTQGREGEEGMLGHLIAAEDEDEEQQHLLLPRQEGRSSGGVQAGLARGRWAGGVWEQELAERGGAAGVQGSPRRRQQGLQPQEGGLLDPHGGEGRQQEQHAQPLQR